MSVIEELKSAIKAKLSELDLVIGWGPGFDSLHATPLFMRCEKDVDKLLWGPLNVHNTATYLPSLKGKKVGIVVKGCDSRSVIELLQEKLVKREELVIFGAPCAGVIDMAKVRRAVGDLDKISEVSTEGDNLVVTVGGKRHSLPLAQVAANKCGRCRYHNALISDVFVGQPLPASVEQDDYADVEAFESQSLEERNAHWQREMQRCIRCYACRNACPLCVCRDHCIAQSRDPHWISQADDVGEKWMFQMIHAQHLAGRCTECGECERACPVGIPLLALKRKLNKEIRELFDYEAGVDPNACPPLQAFKVEEENINERGW